MRGGSQGRRARESTQSEDSPFRHGWTRRRRVTVQVTGAVIAIVLRVLHLIQVENQSGVLGAHARGERAILATWHDGIPMLPLRVTQVCPMFRPRVMLSSHRDGENAAQVVQRFGVQVIRGSSTRGWVGGPRA